MNNPTPHTAPPRPDGRWRQFVHGWFGRAPLSGASADAARHPGKPVLPDKSFRYGDGEAAVLLIHGLTGTPVEMQAVGRGLAKAGFTVYGMQLTGHCGSEDDLLRTGWQDWYASVEQAWRDVSERHQNVFVAGLSMGALMAMHLSVQKPGKIRGIGLYSTTLFYDGWAVPKLSFLLPLFLRTPIGTRYRFIENFPYGVKNERLRDYIHASMLSGNSEEAGNLGMTGRSLRELRKLIDLVKTEAPMVRVPALVLQASNDDLTSPKNSEFLARHLGGPVQVEMLHDCYHMITIDQQRDEVVRLSAEFFNNCLLGGTRSNAVDHPARAWTPHEASGVHQFL